jgi:hypothetical protein
MKKPENKFRYTLFKGILQMFNLLLALLSVILDLVRCLFIFSPADIIMENIVLRQQVRNFKREKPRPHIKRFGRIFWVIQQLRNAFSTNSIPCYMIFDRDSIFSSLVKETIKSFGIETVRTSFRSPWQNGIAERWIGSCRKELLNHVIVLNRRHLFRLLQEYVKYYNEDRTHYSLDKDPPCGRPVLKRNLDEDKVIALPRVGGLHHKYIWKKSA